jgi:large-conductance mechanosensitive channel
MRHASNLKEFLVKYTVIATALTWLVAGKVDKLVTSFGQAFLEPLFSFDLNNDGKPDLKQIKSIVLFNKFPIGLFIIEVLKTLLALFLIWLLIHFVIKKTNLI